MGANHHAPSASEVSAALSDGDRPWLPGELTEEPFDAHESHAMVIATDARGRERADLPMTCARCGLPDVSPQVAVHCRSHGIGSKREVYSVPEILDAIETAALALLIKGDQWGPEAFEAIAFAALDGLRAAKKQGAAPTPEAVSEILSVEDIAPRPPKATKASKVRRKAA